MKALQIHKPGGPEVMQYEDIKLDAPERGEVRMRHTAIGLNYLDTYHRSGAYVLPLPSGLGFEAPGVQLDLLIDTSINWTIDTFNRF